jgi:transposase-like protein
MEILVLIKTKPWGQRLVLRQNKYLNNSVEQDHRCIKRKMRQAMGFYSMITAEKTITGIETMHQLRKGQVPFIDGKKTSMLPQFHSPLLWDHWAYFSNRS